jgi:NAD(P)-dependent dehydrogenase (short-subunit alcohol dehydrogenase family)
MDWMVNSRIRGMVALVVGGGSGMGEATAKTYAANGGRVVTADLNGENAARVASDIVATGGEAISVRMDVADQADIEAGVAATIARFGRLDALVNTSAMVRPAMLEEVPIAEWKRTFDVNVHGTLLLARACLPHLRRSPGPSIVTVSSLAGEHGYVRGSAYGPTKAALTTLTYQMALEWARDGIRVNTVVPGTIDTPMSRASVRREVLADRASKQIPLGHLGHAGEVADLIVFLVSPAASHITAQSINVDGGLAHGMFIAPMGGVTPPPAG